MSVQGVTNSPAATATTENTSLNNLGKQEFLKILMTQLKYQNPLEPMNPDEFLSQLSQLTEVEQLINIASTLENMEKASSKNDLAQWLSLVGKKVALQGNTTVSKGDQIVLDTDGEFDTLTLTLKGSDGNTRELSFSPGDPLTYTHDEDTSMTVSTVRATKGDKTVDGSVGVYRVVSSVIRDSGSGIMIALRNGEIFTTDQVLEIKE
jgi:flagellar basal-body rod modification protein FlgD